MLDAAPSALADHALQQDPAFVAALKLCGQHPVTLPGGLNLLYRKIAGVPVAMLPRAMPPPDLAAQLHAVGLARTPLILSPERPAADMQAIRVRQGMRTATIDLHADTESRRRALHPKWRNQLCRAEESDLQIASRPLAPDDPLLGLEAAQSRTRGYANWPMALTSAFAAAAPEQTRLLTANLNGHPVAHMLFLRHGSRATYHIGHSTHLGRIHHAHNLLLWTATCWLASMGHTTLDLGLLHEGAQTLNRFKLRSGATAHLTGGTWIRWRPLAHRAHP